MSPDDDGRVVVGLDGSPTSVGALRWAAARARTSGARLEIVLCWPDPATPFVHDVPGHFCAPRARAIELLKRALDVTAEDLSGVRRGIYLENDHPVDALVSRCSPADLLVVGASHPREGREWPPVDELCQALAPCRVVVVEAAGAPSDGEDRPLESTGIGAEERRPRGAE